MKKWMWTKKTVTLLFALFIAVTTVAFATYQTLLTIDTSGTMTSAELSSVPTSIVWGDVDRNMSVIKSLSLTNTGDVPVTVLYMLYELPLSFSGTLTWDLEGQAIVVGETKIATFNLTVTDAPDGSFSFDITIDGDV